MNALPTLREVRGMLGAILPLTRWLPPSGPFRVFDELSHARGNPDEPRTFSGSDAALAYLRRQVERSDWQGWRARASVRRGPFARRRWPWTIGDALDPSLVLKKVDADSAVVYVEIPLIAIDRSEVILRAQTQGVGDVEDHEFRFIANENGAWIRKP